MDGRGPAFGGTRLAGSRSSWIAGQIWWYCGLMVFMNEYPVPFDPKCCFAVPAMGAIMEDTPARAKADSQCESVLRLDGRVVLFIIGRSANYRAQQLFENQAAVLCFSGGPMDCPPMYPLARIKQSTDQT